MRDKKSLTWILLKIIKQPGTDVYFQATPKKEGYQFPGFDKLLSNPKLNKKAIQSSRMAF